LSIFILQSVVEGTIDCAYVIGATAGIGLKIVSKVHKAFNLCRPNLNYSALT